MTFGRRAALCLEYLRLPLLSEPRAFDAETSWNVTEHQRSGPTARVGGGGGEEGGLEVKGPFMFCAWKQNKADYSRLGDFFYPSCGVLQGGFFFFFLCVTGLKK